MGGSGLTKNATDATADISAVATDLGDASARANFQSILDILGLPDAANSCLDDMLRTGYNSSAITANADGSVMERLENLQAELSGTAGIATFPNAAVPANTVSLAEVIHDIWASLCGTAAGENGVQTWPASAVPGNGKSIAEVLGDIWDVLRNGTGGSEPATNKSIIDYVNSGWQTALGNWNFTDDGGVAGAFNIFTVTGDVLVQVFGVCQVDLDSGGAATVELGIAGNTAALIAQTTATTVDAYETWQDSTPEANPGAVDLTARTFVIANGADIILTIGSADLTAGSVNFVCRWTPISATGNVVAV